MSTHVEEKVSSHEQESEVTAATAAPSVTGSAAFQAKYMGRDIAAGLVTGVMAIPLSVGIAIMSDYPIKIGLATVVFASIIGWIFAWFRPGNYIGSPGIAAGLAPAIALGVASFGVENMAFCIFLTAVMQAVCWKYNWQRYLLVAIPVYLVEGLLAGVGLKIFLKFFEFTYEIPAELVSAEQFWNEARIQMFAVSMIMFAGFLYLFSKFKDKQPAVPYFALIITGVIVAQYMHVPMLYVEDVELKFQPPIPHTDSPLMIFYMVLFCAMLASIDVIEQVMSNAAIEKIDPLKRKCNSNNSLLAIWVANMGSSLFGGLTNLDGLAKSTTNRLAGAYTKFSILFIAAVVGFFMMNTDYLAYLPKFAIAAIMLLSGYKMVAGLVHVTHHGTYAMMLAVVCGLLVFKLGIFEGLLIAMVIHGLIHFLVYLNHEKIPGKEIVKRYFDNLKKKSADVS